MLRYLQVIAIYLSANNYSPRITCLGFPEEIVWWRDYLMLPIYRIWLEEFVTASARGTGVTHWSGAHFLRRLGLYSVSFWSWSPYPEKVSTGIESIFNITHPTSCVLASQLVGYPRSYSRYLCFLTRGQMLISKLRYVPVLSPLCNLPCLVYIHPLLSPATCVQLLILTNAIYFTIAFCRKNLTGNTWNTKKKIWKHNRPGRKVERSDQVFRRLSIIWSVYRTRPFSMLILVRGNVYIFWLLLGANNNLERINSSALNV